MSGKPGAPGCELLAAVPGLKQLTNTRLPLLSPAPFALSSVSSSSRFQFSFHFTLGFLLLSFTFPLFFASTRGSPWQCAGAGDRKWVSGSAQATGSGWLRSGCNLSPITPAELLSTLHLRLLTIDALHGINIIYLELFFLD